MAMARSQDLMPAHQEGWIHELARAEVHPEAERLLQLGRNFDPQQLVEESAINFLSELRDYFDEYARFFNMYSENGSKFQEIKVYTVAQSAADFMLFRNQIKLVFTNSAQGVIQISFAQHLRGTLAVNGQETLSDARGHGNVPLGGDAHELFVQVGPFRDVYWTFQGEKVEASQVAKFYFAEFAKMSKDTKKSKVGNQLLLDQIKALLQEKGLEL
jgi:hypothetical protein